MFQTNGVQVFGIQTTSVPRRKDHKTSILETYEFVANERVAAAKPEVQDYLVCCSFAAYSISKCLEENDKALPITSNLVTQLSQIYIQNRSVDAIADSFPQNEKFALLKYLLSLKGDCSNTRSTINTQEDVLLNSIYSSNYLKPAVDIVLENCGTHRLKLIELVRSNSLHCYGKVLDFYDNSPLIKTDYTLWAESDDDATEYTDPRVTVHQLDYTLSQLPLTGHDLVLCSQILQVSCIRTKRTTFKIISLRVSAAFK